MSNVAKKFTMALVQFKVSEDKCVNLKRALCFIKSAVVQGAKMVCLPECFNSPYGTNFFKYYAEHIPNGETSVAMAKAAKECGIYIVAGSIPESDGCYLYNTCTVWSPCGQLIAKHRKVHLFDIDIPGKMTFKESDVLSPGNSLNTFQTEFCKVGLGICYDIRFEEMARLYRKQDCEMILYPGAFNLTTGPPHWDALLRGRALDTQCFVAGISPATDHCAKYVAYGHSVVISPWGKTLASAGHEEVILLAVIDMEEIKTMRSAIPTDSQRRFDLYETINKGCNYCAQPPCSSSSKCDKKINKIKKCENVKVEK